MTTIAWDGKELAADKLACYGNCRYTVTKVFRVGNCLVGGAGDFSFVLAMVEWVKGGRDPSVFPPSQRDKDDWAATLVIEPDGSASLYERTPQPIRWEQPFGAIGSGKEYALAAMHLGKTAAEAVAVANELDPCSGNGVDRLPLNFQ